MTTQIVGAIRRVHVPTLVLLSAIVVACRRDGHSENPDWRRVERWLTCEECVAGERDSVIARGMPLVPLLSLALDGPPDSISQNLARSTGATYHGVREQFDRQAPADQALRPLGDSTLIVQTSVANFQRAYKTRAALALHAITPASAQVLFRRYLAADSAGTAPLDTKFRLVLDSLSRTPP